MLNEKKVLMTGLILLIIFSGIGVVSAETLTGTLGGTGAYYSYPGSYTSGGGGGTDYTNATYMVLYNTEYLSGTVSYVRWDIDFTGNNYVKFKVANTEPGEATNFIGYIGADQVCTGTIGYQRYWNGLGVEQAGYQYVVFNNDWNLSTKTGTQYLNLSYNHAAIHYMYYDGYGAWQNPSPPTGYMQFRLGTTLPNGNYDVRGNHQILKQDSFTNTYSVTRPAGIGTSGTITKGGYNSKIYIVNATSLIPVASELTVTPTNYNFTTTANPIYIAAYSSLGNWYNSSVLFQSTVPTPTPTPTVTPVDPFGITPPGYVRSMCQNTNSETDGAVHYSNMSIRDVQNSSWNNVTSRFDGTWYIDTLPNHTIDCYGSAPGYTSASRLGLPASQSMMYELFLFPGYVPPASSGKVRLYVLVNDRQTSAPINGALVTISGSGQTTVSQTTGKTGDVVLEWVNLSTVYATASKYGYQSASRTLTTTANGPDTLRIELDKNVITVAPTSTIPPGGVTPAVTMDTRSSNEKDLAMMDMIRSAGPQLISIAIAATAFGLLGLIMKSMKF